MLKLNIQAYESGWMSHHSEPDLPQHVTSGAVSMISFRCGRNAQTWALENPHVSCGCMSATFTD